MRAFTLKQKTCKVDYQLLDLGYAGNTLRLDSLTLEDLVLLASVAWRQEDIPESSDCASKHSRFRSSSPTEGSTTKRRPYATSRSTKGRQTSQQARSAAATTGSDKQHEERSKSSSPPDYSSMQRDTKHQINTGTSYRLVTGINLAPIHKHGCTQCPNCNKQHWHDQPCDRSKDCNYVLPNSQRHSQATRKLIERMNNGKFRRLSQRFQGGKDGKPSSRAERSSASGSSDKLTEHSGSRASQAKRAAMASAKLKPASAPSENDLCSEDDYMSDSSDETSVVSSAIRIRTCITHDANLEYKPDRLADIVTHTAQSAVSLQPPTITRPSSVYGTQQPVSMYLMIKAISSILWHPLDP